MCVVLATAERKLLLLLLLVTLASSLVIGWKRGQIGGTRTRATAPSFSTYFLVPEDTPCTGFHGPT